MSEQQQPEKVRSPGFDYTVLVHEQRVFVQQKAAQIHGNLKRTAENIVAIGLSLQEVKERLPHGIFLRWLQEEFALSYRTALHFMRVAERFSDKIANFATLPVSVLYELAAPTTPEALIERVQQGELAPTLEAIRAAKAAEQQAREQAQELAERLQAERSEALAQIQRLTKQIEDLHQQLQRAQIPQIQFQEVAVGVPVISSELTTELETLREHVRTLTAQRDRLAQEAERLGEQLRARFLQDQEPQLHQRMHLAWLQGTESFQASGELLLARWPSPLDVQSCFDAEDFARLAHIKQLARRVLEACEHVTQSQVVEAPSCASADRSLQAQEAALDEDALSSSG